MSASRTKRGAKKPQPKPYKCAICDKAFPSPEAGSAHLDKKHNGHGYLSWFQFLPSSRAR